jgi:Xaa-Pro dipeptidase
MATQRVHALTDRSRGTAVLKSAAMDLLHLATLHRQHVADLQSRYETVLREHALDAIVIHSGSLRKRSEFDDQYWPLRPVPHFQHWSPLAQPDCALIVATGKKPRLAWLKAFDFWEQPHAPETDHFVGSFEVVEIQRVEQVEELAGRGTRVAFVGEDTSRAALWGIEGIEAVNPPALLKALDALRTTKTAYEVLCLQEANRRAAKGHGAVLEAFLAGAASELDLHLLYLRATAQDDPETPYKNIVALNEHAATLHHVSYTKHPSSAPAQSLLVDAGAAYQGYCSDVTRTWVKGTGATASAFGALVAGVEELQQKLCTAVAVGTPYERLHDESHRLVAGVLRDVGIASLSEDELVTRGITRAFFPHGLGHSLGLQCHDVGCALLRPRADNPFLRNTSIIDVGQVFTIEPGIYFIEPLLGPVRAKESAGIDWALVKEMSALGGVRIEDDLVVRGAEEKAWNLTREAMGG